MPSQTTRAALTATAVILCAVTACANKQPVLDDRPIADLTFETVDTTTKPFSDNKYEHRDGCPWMPEETIQALTPDGYVMRWNVVKFANATLRQCLVNQRELFNANEPAWTFAVVTHTKDLVPSDPLVTPWWEKTSYNLRNSEVAKGYAGVAWRSSTLKTSNWRCGQHLISSGQADRNLVERSKSKGEQRPVDTDFFGHNARRFMLHQVKQLCGTVDAPRASVTDFPQLTWFAHQVYGGPSPETFGVPKPSKIAQVAKPGT